MKSIIIYALATCYLYPLVCSSNILVFMPSSSKSHKNTFDPLIEELIKRNHSVTEVTMYPSSKSMPGKKTIFTEFIRKKSDEFAPLSWQMSASSTLTTIWMIMGFGTSICPLLYEDPALLEFIKNPGGPYDLVLVSSIFNDCYLSVVGTYGAPVVMISPSAIWPDVAWQMDIPNPWSYSPFLLLPYSSEMTFFQRLWNSLLSGFWTGVRWFIMHPSCDSTVQKFVPNAPSIRDVIKNVSFLLVNSHVSMDDPKPLMPYMAEVGAMHCRPAQKLPEEFDKFVRDSGDDGFIVFSMGSVVEGQYLPQHILDAFKEAFAKLKQRVVWKFEKPMEGLSSNVMISKWIPQQDLIGHPKCRLAITHGGLLSLQEVAYHGVPLLGFPVGADRDGNLNRAVQQGFAEIMDWRTVNSDIIFQKINQIVSNKRYKEKVSEISSLLKDRPQTPVNTSVYWVEYVIRHKGAKHLRSGAEHLNFWQYFLIDVIAVVVLAITSIIALFIFIVRKLVQLVLTKRKKPSPKRNEKTTKKGKQPSKQSGKLKQK